MSEEKEDLERRLNLKRVEETLKQILNVPVSQYNNYTHSIMYFGLSYARSLLQGDGRDERVLEDMRNHILGMSDEEKIVSMAKEGLLSICSKCNRVTMNFDRFVCQSCELVGIDDEEGEE